MVIQVTKFNTTRKGSEKHAELASKALTTHVGHTLSRQELFVMQYTKLCNYHGVMLAPEWGGNHLDHNSQAVLKLGLAQFLQDVNELSPNGEQWISRKSPYDSWSAKNLLVTSSPPRELGARYEPYLALRGVMITLQYAGRLLAIPQLELLQLKLNLLLDRLVIREAILRMLRPRPLWPEVVVKSGNLNQTLGAIENVQQDP